MEPKTLELINTGIKSLTYLGLALITLQAARFGFDIYKEANRKDDKEENQNPRELRPILKRVDVQRGVAIEDGHSSPIANSDNTSNKKVAFKDEQKPSDKQTFSFPSLPSQPNPANTPQKNAAANNKVADDIMEAINSMLSKQAAENSSNVAFPKRKASTDASRMFEKQTNGENEGMEYFTVVFTGGPCAGKTTALASVSEMLKEMGFDVIIVPEASTLIFSSGVSLDLGTYTKPQGVDFQKALMKLQIHLEETFARIISINSPKPDRPKQKIILCDRGLMDGKAYLESDQWDMLLLEMGIEENSILELRYDVVIHMVTAADGAEEFYQKDNNLARHEGINLAKELDRKLKEAWKDHPNFYLINNDGGFEQKLEKVREVCLLNLGMPIQSTWVRKFIIKDNRDLFSWVVKRNKLEHFNITDSFFVESKTRINPWNKGKSSEENTVETVNFLRKRENNLRLTFLKCKKKKALDEKNKQIIPSSKQIITWREYCSILDMRRKETIHEIHRERCCHLYKDM